MPHTAMSKTLSRIFAIFNFSTKHQATLAALATKIGLIADNVGSDWLDQETETETETGRVFDWMIERMANVEAPTQTYDEAAA